MPYQLELFEEQMKKHVVLSPSSPFAVALLVCICLGTWGHALSQDIGKPTVVILVRHAEKDTGSVDPPLTQRGLDRSLALARLLGDVDISAIYVTQFIRTQQTVKQLSSLHGLEPKLVSVDISNPRLFAATLAKNILKEHSGQTVLVSSHSNVIPSMIEALGAGPKPTIGDNEFDSIFIITRYPTGTANLMRLRYGQPTQ
jgi:broad specificity phosphatase PhoE